MTQTIGSADRLYTPATAEPLTSAITVPASVLMPHEPDLPVPPESWLRRTYTDLRRYRVLERGGLFWAAETPDQFAAEIRRAFAWLR